MTNPLRITSEQNSKIKLVKRLRSKRGRVQAQRFLIDYERDLQRALACGYTVDYVLYCPEIAAAPTWGEVESYQVTPQLLNSISYRENPAGMVAILHSRPAKGLAHISSAAPNHIVVLVKLSVPGNVGALLRTADAAGIDAVILVDSALDLYNPNVIRSSTGACFRENVYRLGGGEALAYLREKRFRIVAAAVDGATSLFELEFRGETAIILGSEDLGLPHYWLKQADQLVRIPMAGGLTDSLNVSVSGAILMYERFRQRCACRHNIER